MSGERQFTPGFFQDLLDDEYQQKHNRYETWQNNHVKGDAPNAVILKTIDSTFIRASEPLKRAHVKMLAMQAEQCYPDKWMSQTFSNEEQINICKQDVHDRVFGKLEAYQNGFRDSSRFRFQDCETNAGNNIVKFV